MKSKDDKSEDGSDQERKLFSPHEAWTHDPCTVETVVDFPFLVDFQTLPPCTSWNYLCFFSL